MTEEHNYWLSLWNLGDIPFHKQDVSIDLLAFFSALNLKLGAHILVPLCGKSEDMFWFVQHGFKVTGVELSEIACQEFFTEHNFKVEITTKRNFKCYRSKNIELLCGDFFNLSAEILEFPVDSIYDCNALIALRPEMRKKYIQYLLFLATSNVRMLLLSIDSPNKIIGPPFPVSHIELEKLFGENFNIKLLKRSLLNEIPERLSKKGYTEIIKTAYLISSIE